MGWTWKGGWFEVPTLAADIVLPTEIVDSDSEERSKMIWIQGLNLNDAESIHLPNFCQCATPR